ncbi:PREDICTED: uncharacterized protein LOC109150315 [Ipomoea nil]|uniref:uncharacterized protein LOC109150315 n=1 Tax=Ipomoea nil TaxID=35883 RepID=UPI000900E7A0|nr:PREDICTED: uncharacterized protein LOC109150315 [Ipomoea nil]
MKGLVDELLKIMAKSLNIEEDGFMNLIGDEPTLEARFNFYPKCPKPDWILGVKAHADSSALTILLQDKEVEGLQVSGMATGIYALVYDISWNFRYLKVIIKSKGSDPWAFSYFHGQGEAPPASTLSLVNPASGVRTGVMFSGQSQFVKFLEVHDIDTIASVYKYSPDDGPLMSTVMTRASRYGVGPFGRSSSEKVMMSSGLS